MAWSRADIPDLAGRTAIVTGANSGIGFETARGLAEHGARVLLACRSPEKGEDAEQRLRKDLPDADLRYEPLDLGSLASVRAFAERFRGAESRLDLLCNNAGVMMPPLGRTEDGFETQFGTNHLGHFALTGLLLDPIRSTPGARVVTVSSLVHFAGQISFTNLDARRRYNATMAYGQSKLANLLFARELQRRFEAHDVDAISVAAHPGSTRTNLQQYSRMLAAFVAVLSQDPPGGALPTLYAATAPDVRGGEYFGPSGLGGMTGPPGRALSSPSSRSPALARRLWQVSEELTGVSYLD